MWTYLAYRWPSEAAYLAALAAVGWAEGTPPDVALLATGTVYAPPIDDETTPEALRGWHVAAAFRNRTPPADWPPLEIEPSAEMPVLGRTPAPTLADYEAAIAEHVEAVARSRSYSSAASCAGYINSTVPAWAAEAAAFLAWRDAVYMAAFGTMAEVQQGAPAPRIRDLIAGLPEMEWPA
ncbi:MAG: hypothetical protein K5Q68_16355 [Roseococcus sp.]|nr:hypothetical protein [Roseococcus sp.]